MNGHKRADIRNTGVLGKRGREPDGKSIYLGECDACCAPLYTPVRLMPRGPEDRTESKRNDLICGKGCKPKR